MKALATLEKGDLVTRTIGGSVEMPLEVTEITPTRIICGAWEFDRITGGEIDEDLGWDSLNTGSIIKPYGNLGNPAN